jgi:alpha-1,2-mannosyltransferase
VLQLAQISPLLLLSVVGGLYFLHTRRPVAAGVALAFGTVLKLSPILFVLWLLARREYRAFAASLIAMTLLSLLTLAVTGAAPFERFFRHVLPILSQGTTFDYNISIVAIAGWIFDLGSPRRPEFLPPDLRLTLVKLIFYGLVLGVSGWALWRTQRAEAPARLSGEYALINMTLLLISPITWSHHVLHALLPIFLVTVQEISRRRYALLAGAALCYLLILQVPDLPSSLLADWFGAQTGTAAAFIGLVSLWLLACASLSQRDESPPWEREPQDADS